MLALKDNHPTLHDDVRASFAEARATGFAGLAPAHHSAASAVVQDHGRLAIRRAWVISDSALLAYLDEAGRWAGLRGIGLVEAERRSGGRRSVEVRHFLLSQPLDAATFARAVRRHWGIENKLHWVLDVTCNEDASRVRAGRAAQNLAALRQLALNLLRRDASRRGSVATKRFRAALDQGYLAALLATAPPANKMRSPWGVHAHGRGERHHRPAHGLPRTPAERDLRALPRERPARMPGSSAGPGRWATAARAA